MSILFFTCDPKFLHCQLCFTLLEGPGKVVVGLSHVPGRVLIAPSKEEGNVMELQVSPNRLKQTGNDWFSIATGDIVRNNGIKTAARQI